MVRRSKWEMVLSSRGIFSFEWPLSLCAINREVNWTVSKCRLRYLIVKATWKQLLFLSVILKVLRGNPVLILVSRIPEQEGNDALRSTENSSRRIELPEERHIRDARVQWNQPIRNSRPTMIRLWFGQRSSWPLHINRAAAGTSLGYSVTS